ncbi:MAG: PD40 domain-containing protein [Bacteroidales bacterium]|nr:PD40 domain-containing protein [Bacteroidales bacterium]
MRRHICPAIAILLFISSTLVAQETPRWLRHAAISPDGQTVAFAYQGDIFTVNADGGQARQITSSPYYESDPLWSADGKQLIFSSLRDNSKDIWVVPATGGTPRQLTTFTGEETPLAVLPDGTVIYSANILPDTQAAVYPNTAQLYKVPLAGGKSELVASINIPNMAVSADGAVLYEDYKGYEDGLRKHHTSSVTRDIWYYNDGKPGFTMDSGGTFTRLTTFAGEDRNPVFAPGGKEYYFLSERGGTFNVWKGTLDGSAKPTQITAFETHPVRGLSISAGGKLLFSFNGDLYTMKEGAQPVKLAVTVTKDKLVKDKVRRQVNFGAVDIAASPNGKEVALESRGDIFVTSIEHKTTRRITCTPERERGVCFSDDGRELYYAAERNGSWGIWKTYLTEKKDKYFTFTFDFKEERVTPEGVTCTNPVISPDGKYLAYFKDRTDIVVRNLKSGKDKTVLQGALYSYKDGDLDFEWSPDSRYLLSEYQADGGWNNTDIALIEVETAKVTNLTRSGYSDSNFRWALGGKAMTWASDKAGYRSHGSWGAEKDIYIMFFDGEAYYKFTRDEEEDKIEKLLSEDDKKAKKKEEQDSIKVEKGKIDPLVLDLDNREDRIVRLTGVSARMGDHFLSSDGTKLLFVQRLEKGYDLCQLDIKSRSVKVIDKGVRGSFFPSPDGKSVFLLSSMSIKKLDPNTGKGESISFADEYDYYPAAEREYILAHAWKQVKEKFYDETIHGIDWDGFYENYKQFLPYIDNNYDYRELLSEFLGELNASHTGARYRPTGGSSAGRLGVLYDDGYDGEGLKIKEILPGSCLALVKPDLKEGDIITSVDGVAIAPGTAWYDALRYTSGKKTVLGIKSGHKETKVTVKPVSSDSEGLYKRWIRRNEQLVEKLSGGRVGYVHVQGMNSDSFREVYSRALGKYRSCDALIVDTRHNGGGWLHDDLATFLGGKPYIDFKPRGQYIGTEPYSKWNKPSCVLICEDDYSDASGFPYIYKQLGIGKLIGAPVPGTMTAVWWETQIDPTLVFGIPEVTSVSRADGSVLENQQIEPDILVFNDPASVLAGEDRQIETAVAEMLRQIDNK